MALSPNDIDVIDRFLEDYAVMSRKDLGVKYGVDVFRLASTVSVLRKVGVSIALKKKSGLLKAHNDSLVKLLDAGVSMHNVAKHFGVSAQAVSAFAKKNGIGARNRKPTVAEVLGEQNN